MENNTKVVIKDVRLSYVHVWEKSSMNNDDANAKYSACIIIPKTDKANLDAVNRAIEAAKLEGQSKKFGGKIPANLKLPLRDGDIDRPEFVSGTVIDLDRLGARVLVVCDPDQVCVFQDFDQVLG